MGTHWVYCKYLLSNQMLSDRKHIAWKLVYFCIDSYKQLFNIEDASRVIGSFLINPQLECFEISLTFHGLLLWLQKKIEMKIFLLISGISGIFGKKIHGYCNALLITEYLVWEEVFAIYPMRARWVSDFSMAHPCKALFMASKIWNCKDDYNEK